MFKLDGPFLNDWVEVAPRRVSGKKFHSRIMCGNYWYWILVEDMTDGKFA